MDRDLKIQFVNQPRSAGWSIEDLRGTPALEFVAPERREAQRRMLLHVFESGEETEFEVPVVSEEGGVRWYEGAMRPIRRDGEIAAVLVVSRDVTALRKAEREAKELRELIPLCSWCGKIRRDEGYWTTVESYIEEHGGGRVTHGMCPECDERHGDTGTDGS